MIDIQNTKVAQLVAPQTIGTTAVSGYVDTLGYDHLRVYYIGATAVSTDTITALKLQEGDTTSAFTDITGAVGGTSFDIPAPNTSTPDTVVFDVNLAKARKRYVNISITGDATTRTTSVIGVLGRAAVSPDTDTLAGAKEIVYV
jgi:hypothetical protein